MVSESNIYVNGRIFTDLNEKRKSSLKDPEKEQQKIIFDLLYSVKESENIGQNSFVNLKNNEEKASPSKTLSKIFNSESLKNSMISNKSKKNSGLVRDPMSGSSSHYLKSSFKR